MGSTLAHRLSANHQLIVWDINPSAISALKNSHVSAAQSPVKVAEQCDIIFLCLPRSMDVAELMFGSGGMAAALSPGTLIIDHTSGLPAETREISARLKGIGVELIEAAVSGGTSAAQAGTLSIMVCGASQRYQKALPLLNSISSNILECGDNVGDAQAVKLLNNLLNAGYRIGTLEAVALGRKLGFSLAEITESMNTSEARNSTSLYVLRTIVNEQLFPYQATIALMLKDVDQVIQLSMKCGAPAVLAMLVRGLLHIVVSTRGLNAQGSELIQFFESLTGDCVVDGTGQDRTASTLTSICNAVAACNELLTYEMAAIATKYGLNLEAVSTVINKSSGCSGTTERILPALTQGRLTDGTLIEQKVQDLKFTTRLALEYGTPMLMASVTYSILNMALHSLDAHSGEDVVGQWYESIAGTKFNNL